MAERNRELHGPTPKQRHVAAVKQCEITQRYGTADERAHAQRELDNLRRHR